MGRSRKTLEEGKKITEGKHTKPFLGNVINEWFLQCLLWLLLCY